jgi:transcriptional regulator with XRE-family HTH domain
MENAGIDQDLDQLIAQRLKSLRSDRGWSLDELAKRSGISRATLSRLENADVSPTASVLGKLCAAYGMTMSRLIRMVEESYAPVIRRGQQMLWIDPESGYRRHSISPPAQSLAGEVLHCELPPHTRIDYEDAPRPGLEHHLVLVDGQLDMTIGSDHYALDTGDCLRFQLFGSSSYQAGADGAAYFLFLV